MPKRLTASELTKLIDTKLRTLDPATAEFSPDRQSELKFREYTIRSQQVLVSSPAHDQDPEEGDFRKKTLTVGMSLLSTIKDRALQQPGKTVFIPLAECRHGRQHWVLLVRETNGSWHCYDPKAAGWGCGLFSCLNHQLYDTSHFETLLGTNDINFHYTGIQNLFNREICGYVVAHLITCLAQGQTLDEANRSFNIKNYLPKTSRAEEEEAFMGLPTSYGTAAAPAVAADDDGYYVPVDSEGGINGDEEKKKGFCCIS